MKKCLIILSILCVSAGLWAQTETEEIKGAHPYHVEENEEGVADMFAHWSIIPHAGFNVFDGDFNSEIKHPVSVPTAGLAIEYSFTPVWSIGVEYMFDRYTVTGKPGFDNADTLLHGDMHKAAGYVSLDLMNLFFPKARKKVLGIQPMVGGGYAWYKNSIMYFDDTRYHTGSHEPTAMTGFKGALFFSAGLNVEFNLNRTLALGVRATYDYFVNDYPDGRGYSGQQALASKNNDGIVDVTLNMRIKLKAVPKTHVRNVEDFDTWKKPESESREPMCVHDTVIIKHDSIIIRETVRQMQKEQKRVYYVYFENNRSKIDDQGLITIQQVADVLSEDTTLYAVVTGYCDNTGSSALNYALGDKRAANVIAELREEHLIDTTRMYAMGLGKLIGHRSQASYGPNRRAVIRLVDKNTFERMKSELDDKRANRILEEDSKAPAPAATSASRPKVKTVPLEESAAPVKVNEYKQRASEEVIVDKTTTLSKLARQYYNNTYCWVYIYIANKDKIQNPNTLTPGVKLTIPELTQEEMRITKDQSLVLYGNARQSK